VGRLSQWAVPPHAEWPCGDQRKSVVKFPAAGAACAASYGETMRERSLVLTSWIDVTTWAGVIETIEAWAAARESRYVCLCNVHSVVNAWHDPAFASVLNDADLALPDGAPVALSLRLEGFRQQRRINGPDLMWRYLAHAEASGQSVYFYGAAAQTLARLRSAIESAFPKVRIAGMLSPPFRELTALEDLEHVRRINESGAGVVFVGLGCPKQEQWMAAHRGVVRAVMVGVGAAIDYHGGTVKRAPRWMQSYGLEWAHRLATEPRRLLWRYLSTNTVFMLHMLGRLVGWKH
jgi:N-acetylglucosaminyldiphosphoundecaprenol N-acetyl-beta-D-mannosaminyltransferase